MSESVLAHKVGTVDVLTRFGLTVYRVTCSCGWQSALMSSRKITTESFGWHASNSEGPRLCVRWGDGPDRCLRLYEHVGSCVDAFGQTTQSLTDRFLGRAL